VVKTDNDVMCIDLLSHPCARQAGCITNDADRTPVPVQKIGEALACFILVGL